MNNEKIVSKFLEKKYGHPLNRPEHDWFLLLDFLEWINKQSIQLEKICICSPKEDEPGIYYFNEDCPVHG